VDRGLGTQQGRPGVFQSRHLSKFCCECFRVRHQVSREVDRTSVTSVNSTQFRCQ
jgi:hypothetical protein